MHYLLTVPELEGEDTPTTIDGRRAVAVEAGRDARSTRRRSSLDDVKDESGQGFHRASCRSSCSTCSTRSGRTTSTTWTSSARAIHYRSWGQKDPLIEYKQEAYTMFVDLMNDIHTTFTERFLRAQLVFRPAAAAARLRRGRARSGGRRPERRVRPAKRYNALGILEDIPAEEPERWTAGGGRWRRTREVMDVAPDEPPKRAGARGRIPMVVGAGRARTLSQMAASTEGVGRAAADVDWSSVGRNDPCPCGSGKKFKKCHGANADGARRPPAHTLAAGNGSAVAVESTMPRCFR